MLSGHRRKLLALLGGPSVHRVVVEHRGRVWRFGSEYVEAALGAQGGELVVVDAAEVDDDLVRDMTEILTSMCARLVWQTGGSEPGQACPGGGRHRGRAGGLMAKFEVPEGWGVQAFRFTLDPTEDQARALARHFGARRKAFNWTVATLKADIDAWHATGVETAKPSPAGAAETLEHRQRPRCASTPRPGRCGGRECSKEAYADGIAGAVDAYWNWQHSPCWQARRQAGRVSRAFKKKGRDADRVCFTTGAMRVEPDRRHLTLPVIGTVRTHENTRRIERLIGSGRARVLAISVRRQRHPAGCECAGPGPAPATTAAWRYLVRGSVSMSGCGAWPPSPTADGAGD